MPDFNTVIFDLDGTLYDEERIYDRYAEELARALPVGTRDDLIREWGEIKSGSKPRRIGLGYDEARGMLFSHVGGRVSGYLTWDGVPVPWEPADGPGPKPLFGEGRVNIGDWWGVLSVLAARKGVGLQERRTAFNATRTYMKGEGRLPPAEQVRPVLRRLRDSGLHLIAMSNSPVEAASDTFEQLGIADCFAAIIADAAKPAGLATYLEALPAPRTALSVGDNFVNDIEPALDAGSLALYIDRHHTGLGADHPRCVTVRSLDAAFAWLRAAVP